MHNIKSKILQNLKLFEHWHNVKNGNVCNWLYLVTHSHKVDTMKIMPKITSGVDIWLIVELLVRKSSFSQWKIWVQFLALAPNSKFLVTEILGGSQVVGKAVRFLSIMWETWTGFLTADFWPSFGISTGLVLAAAGMCGMRWWVSVSSTCLCMSLCLSTRCFQNYLQAVCIRCLRSINNICI